MTAPAAPTYDLATVQERVKAGRWVPTTTAVKNAIALQFDSTDIVDCILGLDDGDFYKTMESNTVPGTMQDVYRPMYLSIGIYLKLQLDDRGKTVVIQFKKDQSR